MRNGSNDLYRTLVLTILAGMGVLLVGLANRDVYSKDVVDTRFESVEHDMEDLKIDVRWLVRRMGGVPSAEAREGDNTPQSDER